MRKISSPPGFDTRTVQTVASRYTNWAILIFSPRQDTMERAEQTADVLCKCLRWHGRMVRNCTLNRRLWVLRQTRSVIVIHSVVCPAAGPSPLPYRVLHRMRSSASSFSFQHSRVRLNSSSSFLLLLPHLPVTSIFSSNFPAIKCFRKQFLHQMCAFQLAFLLFTVCSIFLCSLALYTSFFTRSVQLISLIA